MYILKKIRAKVFGLPYQPNRKELEETERRYRSMLDNDILKYLPQEDFANFVYITCYTKYGYLTAIQAAFCLGFKDGQSELKERIERFGKGGVSNG